MKIKRRLENRWFRANLALCLSMGLVACGGGSDSTIDGQSESAAGRRNSTPVVAQATSTEGRLLASNCFQCHGTEGTGGFEEIRGKSANELIEFQSKPAGKDIMAAHAQGYTPDQLRKIAAYLNK